MGEVVKRYKSLLISTDMKCYSTVTTVSNSVIDLKVAESMS